MVHCLLDFMFIMVSNRAAFLAQYSSVCILMTYLEDLLPVESVVLLASALLVPWPMPMT